MGFLWQLLAAIVIVWGLCILSPPLWIWSGILILGLAFLEVFNILSPLASFYADVGLILLLLILNVSFLRRALIIKPCFRLFQKVLPSVSSTEREAIEAGDIFWEGELFRGRPNWAHFFQLPKPKLTDEELQFINNQVETLCGMLDDWQITHKDLDLIPEVWEFLKREKFLGLIIPKSYGGLGFSALANSTIVQKICSRSLTAAVTVMVPNSLGPAELLLHYGTEAQKNEYLPHLAVGKEIPCFALTGPEAGSDAGAIPDKGIVCKGMYEGKEILGMRLTWDKRYITLAPVATVLGLTFKLYDPDGLLGGKKDLGITLCLLPTNHPGVQIGKRHFPLNQPFMNGPTQGKDVFVPLEWIIGGPKMAGRGWRMIVESLSAGRGISLPSVSASAAKQCYRLTGAYARVRQQFNISIGHFEGVEAKLAEIAGHTYLIEATRLLTLSAIDNHKKPAVATSITKYHTTELACTVARMAMDVHGGRGIMLGPNNYLGRCYESMPISVTVEGANILMRNLMIFGQGAIRCHPYLQLEMAALNNRDINAGLKTFDTLLGQHIRYSLSRTFSCLFHAWTNGLFIRVPQIKTSNSRNTASPPNATNSFSFHSLQPFLRALTRMSLNLSFLSDIVFLLLGGKLKRRERLSARLGDVLSYLYMASAVLKYYHDFGDEKTECLHVKWALSTCLYRIQEAFLEFLDNFRFPFIAFCLKRFIFPYGRVFCPPHDNLEHQMAVMMMTPSPFRDRLTEHCYLGKSESDCVWQLEQTFLKMVEAEPLLTKVEKAAKAGLLAKEMNREEKIREALKTNVLNEEEAGILMTFEKMRFKAISVDAFTHEELKGW